MTGGTIATLRPTNSSNLRAGALEATLVQQMWILLPKQRSRRCTPLVLRERLDMIATGMHVHLLDGGLHEMRQATGGSLQHTTGNVSPLVHVLVLIYASQSSMTSIIRTLSSVCANAFRDFACGKCAWMRMCFGCLPRPGPSPLRVSVTQTLRGSCRRESLIAGPLMRRFWYSK